MASSTSFRFRFGAWRALLSALGLGPGSSRVELDNGILHVVMGWGFRAAIPVAQITGVRPRRGLVGGIGVHGWRGHWLVNGATTGLLTITVDPPVRARATGLPIVLRELTLSLEDPGALSGALGH